MALGTHRTVWEQGGAELMLTVALASYARAITISAYSSPKAENAKVNEQLGDERSVVPFV